MTGSAEQARYKFLPDIPMSVAAYGNWVRTESDWSSTDTSLQLLLGKSGWQGVSVWQGEEMINSALAVPTYAPLSPSRSEDEVLYFINNVITAKGHRRKGLARQAMIELLDNCERRG